MLQKMQLVRGATISAALALTVALFGCGGNNTFTNYSPGAVYQFGQADFSSTFANRNTVSSALTLSGATSAASNGTLFLIADTGNNRILGWYKQIPTSNSVPADFVYGQADMVSNNLSNLLNQPTKVSFSPDGTKLLVVDSGNNRVLIWDTNLVNFHATGQVNINSVVPNHTIGDGTSTVSATSLSGPTGAAFAPSTALSNRVVVADRLNNRALIYNDYTSGVTATASLYLGQRNFTTGPNTPNCPNVSNTAVTDCTVGTGLYPYQDTLKTPTDVWSDGNSMLISDTGNNRVLYFNSVPTQNEQFATNVIGQTSMIGRSGPAAGPIGLNQPQGVYTDPFTKIIYVADYSNNRVLGFNKPQVDGPSAILVYGQSDYTHVTADDQDQNNITDHPQNNNSIASASTQTLANPSGTLTVVTGATTSNPLNQLFIMDTGNNRMMVFNTN